MHVEYVARKTVRILGVVYQRDELIDDPQITTEVLTRLMNTRRIAQRITRSDGEHGPRPAVPLPPSAATQSTRQPTADTTADTTVDTTVDPLLEEQVRQWNLAWSGADTDISFRKYLLSIAEQHKLAARGSVRELTGRLYRAGIKPE